MHLVSHKSFLCMCEALVLVAAMPSQNYRLFRAAFPLACPRWCVYPRLEYTINSSLALPIFGMLQPEYWYLWAGSWGNVMCVWVKSLACLLVALLVAARLPFLVLAWCISFLYTSQIQAGLLSRHVQLPRCRCLWPIPHCCASSTSWRTSSVVSGFIGIPGNMPAFLQVHLCNTVSYYFVLALLHVFCCRYLYNNLDTVQLCYKEDW